MTVRAAKAAAATPCPIGRLLRGDSRVLPPTQARRATESQLGRIRVLTALTLDEKCYTVRQSTRRASREGLFDEIPRGQFPTGVPVAPTRCGWRPVWPKSRQARMNAPADSPAPVGAAQGSVLGAMEVNNDD
jgi:hypothetical protein